MSRDLRQALVLAALASCALAAIGCLWARLPLRDRRWRTLTAVVAVAVLASALAPGWAAWITAADYGGAILLPGVLQRLVNAAICRQDYVRAAWMARHVALGILGAGAAALAVTVGRSGG